MQEARRQACLAIDFYNRPGDRRSYLDFVVHMHLARQNLLHADRVRRHEPLFYRAKNGRYDKNPDGTRKTWDLSQCLKHEYTDADPIRQNIMFFIGLRNKIEHRFQDAFMATTGPHAHAYVINFEAELVNRFGTKFSLADELRFPVFVQALTPAGVEAHNKVRKRLPISARNYITEFEANLDPAVAGSEKFVYRVQLTPIKGPKTDADMAVTFVSQKEPDRVRGRGPQEGRQGRHRVRQREAARGRATGQDAPKGSGRSRPSPDPVRVQDEPLRADLEEAGRAA